MTKVHAVGGADVQRDGISVELIELPCGRRKTVWYRHGIAMPTREVRRHFGWPEVAAPKVNPLRRMLAALRAIANCGGRWDAR